MEALVASGAASQLGDSTESPKLPIFEKVNDPPDCSDFFDIFNCEIHSL